MTSTAPPAVIQQCSGQLGTGSAAALVLASCVSLQFGAALATELCHVMGSRATEGFRLALAALVLCLVVRPRVLSWNKPQWRAVVAFGFVLALMNGFFYAALARIPLGTAVGIEFLGPLRLAAVLSPSALDLVWVGLAISGMALFGVESVLGLDSLHPLGVAFALIAGAVWALYVLVSAKVGQVVPGTGGLTAALVVAAASIGSTVPTRPQRR